MGSTQSGGKPASPPTLGRRIASQRAALGLTQGQLAAAIDVSPASVSAMELEIRRPSVEVLVRLASALGVSETWLLHGDGPGAASPRNADLAPALA